MRVFLGLLLNFIGVVSEAKTTDFDIPKIISYPEQLGSHLMENDNGVCNQVLPKELSLEEAVERILCHDPRTRSAWANVQARAAQVGIAQAQFFPKITSHLSRTNHNSTLHNKDYDYSNGNSSRVSHSVGLELSWLLLDFGNRNATLSEARESLLAANASEQALLQETLIHAAQAYYNALVMQKSVAASRKVVKLASQNLEVADAKYKAGAAALSDRLQAQTAFSQASLTQIRNESKLRNTLGIIALSMGYHPDTPFRLSGDLDAKARTDLVKMIGELLDEARRDHPSLVAAQARIRAAEASLEQSRTANRPSLTLTANIAHTLNKQSSAFNGDTREHDRSIGLQLSIPLFEGFERSHQIRKALAQRDTSIADLAEAEQQVAMDVWSSFESFDLATLSVERTHELVEQSHQSLEVVQGRYRSGVGSMLELLNALTAYTIAEEQHIEALGSWQSARLRLSASTGKLSMRALAF